MKKRIIWIIVMALVLAYGLLSWVQYEYYGRVLELRTEGIRSQLKEAMGEVAQELQVRELIRYLNRGVDQSKDRFADAEFLPTDVAEFDIWTRTKLDTQIVRSNLSHNDLCVKLSHAAASQHTEDPPSCRLVHAYFSNLHSLDRYILKYLYDSYDKDSIPQLVNVRLLKSLIRKRLDNKNLCGPYQMSLYDYRGRKLYDYIPPSMATRKQWEERCTVVQYLFAPSDGLEHDRPYMKVTLDTTPTKSEVLRLALPSFISTLIVLVLGFSALGVLLKHMSFSTQRTNFINNMTHELKTPVSTILLSSNSLEQSLAEQHSLTPRAQSALGIIALEAQRMKFLIDKVLQFSLLDGASGRFSLETLDVNELLLPVAEIYTFHAQQRGGDLELDLNALNTWVQGSQIHLSNVFFNLLDNAVKYSKTDELLRLAIRTSDEEGGIRICIEDNGIGMAKHDLKHVFDRFYRVTSGKRHDVRGFGLGLAYVTSVISQCGGTITAESELGSGTKMIIHLPASEPD